MTLKQKLLPLLLLGILSTHVGAVIWDDCQTDDRCPDSTCEDQEPGLFSYHFDDKFLPGLPLDVFPTKTVPCSYMI
jgi:hypothetical protein